MEDKNVPQQVILLSLSLSLFFSSLLPPSIPPSCAVISQPGVMNEGWREKENPRAFCDQRKEREREGGGETDPTKKEPMMFFFSPSSPKKMNLPSPPSPNAIWRKKWKFFHRWNFSFSSYKGRGDAAYKICLFARLSIKILLHSPPSFLAFPPPLPPVVPLFVMIHTRRRRRRRTR